MENNELKWTFDINNIDFISLAAKFLNDKKCSREVVRMLYKLRGTNYDNISDKVAFLLVGHVLAELMSDNDEKLSKNIKKKKKKKNVESN